MTDQPTKEDLITLVEKLMTAAGTPTEQRTWLETLERNVPHPEIQGLIFWPERYDLTNNVTAAEIIDKALAYKPISL
jgi:cell division protein YceG involved in septum cleavage